MRGTILVSAAVAALGAGAPALADPTAARILDANHAAMGAGLDGGGAIDVHWDYAGEGLTGDVHSLYGLRGEGYVDTQNLGATTGATGFDGRTAWWKDASGAVTPEAGGDIRQLAVTEAYLDGNL